ncbi:MAG: beta-lactamase family protein [Spirochaetia bacterium]|nr:beta-lactamase family protein [Spirochaetia bacterium]MCF8232756.1 beta-lactamase family protein [Bacteroidales bacterium]
MKHHYYYRMIVSSFAIMLLFIAACDKDSADNKTPKDDLQVILEQTVANENIPGAILGVKTPTDSWLVTAGKADTASAKLMNADMQVWLASVSKPLTAVLTMKLIEEKILSLDDTVEKWLPGLIPQGDQMTIKMLLNHSSGIFDITHNVSFWQELLTNPSKIWTNQELVSRSVPNTPVFPPGTAFSYSNTGYYILGMIMEAATGDSVADLFQQKIAEPAQLTRTKLSRQGALEEPCTNGYTWLFTTEDVVDIASWNFSWDWTAGAGVSTAEDMLQFSDKLFNGEILQNETVDLMTSLESFAPESATGLGIGVVSADAAGNVFETKLLGHSGSNPGFATEWYYFPDYGTTIFVAVNRNDIPEGPDGHIPVNGSAISFDIFTQAWLIVKEHI